MRRRRSIAALSTVLTAAAMVVAITGPAGADTPNVVTPSSGTATADALPTVQIDGVAWDQAIVGNKVYVAGSFANARPAGAPPGTNQTGRNNMLAYDLTTGVLDTGFNPDLNAQAKAVTAAPDGKRVYVAGSFTKAGGVDRNRIAAFDTSTGRVITTFAPQLDFTVNAVVATNSTVYVAGAFSRSGSAVRTRFAAFRASDGALLPWAPSADASVSALVLTPDGSAVIAGGSFTSVNGSSVAGLARLSTGSGALQPWAAGRTIRNSGANAAITSLTTDGKNVFGTGYTFGKDGNLEGAFSADPTTGAVNWVEDCHGDTYDAWAGNGTVYTVSHAHYCGNLGGFPQSDPWSVNMRRALAFTSEAHTTLGHDPYGYFDWFGTPAPAMVNWFPDLAAGSVTGKTQAAWTVTGNDKYVVLGGEFPTVNGAAQQGLVRFATRGTAPAKVGPTYSGALITPSVVPVATGARITWPANSDRDDKTLTYTLTRDGQTVYRTSADTTFWDRPTMSFVDTGLVAGGTYKYRLRVADGDNNSVQSDIVSYRAGASTGPSRYAARVLADGAAPYWPLNETSGSALVDNAGTMDLAASAELRRGVPGAVTGDAATGFANGVSSSTTAAQDGPHTFTIQAWVSSTSTSGGKIVGFGDSRTGSSGTYDRHLYLDSDGRVFFGVYPGAVASINSGPGLNDGRWHQVTGTLGADGMKLYVDGRQVAARADVTRAQAYSGYWRVGGDNVNGWPNQPPSSSISGSLDEVAVYPTVLPAAAVAAQWALSQPGTPVNEPPRADFALTASDLTAVVSGSGSRDSDGSIAGYRWDFGDGSTATGLTASHTYRTEGTKTITLTVTDDRGATGTSSRQVDVTAPNQPPAAVFTATPDGMTVAFDGRGSSDPEGRPVTLAWDFGDGSFGTGATVSHAYATAGPRAVTLTVTDDRGSSSTTTRSVG